MTHYLRWVPLTAEMNPFQAEVGRNQRLMAFRDADNGTVISNAEDQAFTAGGTASNARNQRLFR